MKSGDIFHKMRPIERLRHMAERRYYFQEIYQGPDEVIADLTILFAEMGNLEESRDDLLVNYRRLYNGRDAIMNGVTQAFKQFGHLYKDPDTIKGMRHDDLPNATDDRTPSGVPDHQLVGQLPEENQK